MSGGASRARGLGEGEVPYYVYECPTCGSQCSELRSIDERNDGPMCDYHRDSAIKMELQIQPVPGFVKAPAVPRSSK